MTDDKNVVGPAVVVNGSTQPVVYGYVPEDEARASGVPFELSEPVVIEETTNVIPIDKAPKAPKAKAKQPKSKPVVVGWEGELALTQQGQVDDSVSNLYSILTNHADWAGKICFDERSNRIVIKGGSPATEDGLSRSITDTDAARLSVWLSTAYGMNVSPVSPKLLGAMNMAAKDNAYDPVRDYLSALEWDGVPRVDGLLTQYFKAVPTSETHGFWLQEVGAKFLISAVARTFSPGCQADHVLVFSGKTGYRKSTGVETLASKAFFSDSIPDLHSKDAAGSLDGVWIMEMPELSSMKRSDMNACKAFITRKNDRYRAAYGRQTEDHMRRSVFVGTTEDFDCLGDDTNRRFWPVAINAITDTDKMVADRDQLWAEAVARYHSGEQWHVVDASLLAESLRVQSEHVKQDVWQPKIEAWLASQHETTVLDILSGCLLLETGSCGQREQTRVAQVLKTLRWERYRMSSDQHGHRPWGYRRASVVS